MYCLYILMIIFLRVLIIFILGLPAGTQGKVSSGYGHGAPVWGRQHCQCSPQSVAGKDQIMDGC